MSRLNKWLIGGILLVSGLTLWLPLGHETPNAIIFWQLRVPRLLFALLGGGMIATSALVFQTTLRNRYIDGAMLGMASGAELFNALLVVIFAPALPWRVLTGALFAVIWLFVLRLSILKVLQKPFLLLLGGLALTMFLSAITALITSNQGFLGKSLANVTVQDTWLLALITIFGILLMQFFNGKLQYFALPRLHVVQLGINENRLSLPWEIIGALYLGSVSAVLGTTLFVGLILAQLIVLKGGMNAKHRLIPTALLGALILSLSDFIAHSVTYPNELPTGAILMIITAPFILMLWKGQNVN